MLYKNTKAMVHSPDDDANFFDIVTRDTLVPYMFIIMDETDCISHSTNTLGKDMNPIIPPPAMGK